MTKFNVIQFVISFFMAALLLTGCDMKAPVVDRNAEVSDTSTEKTEATNSEATKIDSEVSEAANELIPEALREFTTLPKDRSAKSLAAYLNSLDGSEFQAAAISVMQSQGENARAGLQVAAQMIQENKQTAADMILGAEDATEDEYMQALSVLMENQIMNAQRTQASPESVSLQLNTLRDKVAKGRFPKLTERVDLVKDSLSLLQKADLMMKDGTPKTEDLNAIYGEYTAQLDKVLAQKLDSLNVFMLMNIAQVFQTDSEKMLPICEKLQAALEKSPVESLKSLSSMLPQQIEALKKDIQLQAITPEEVKAKVAKFKTLPEEKTPAKLTEYLKLLESPEFQETMQSFLEVRKEEVQKTVMDEWKEIETNTEEAAKEIFKAEDATEEEFKTAFEWRLRLAMAYAADEEKPSFAQMEERYTVLKDEVEKSKFPQFAPRAAVCAQAAAILEKAAPIFEGTTQATPEQKDALYPDLLKLAEDAAKNDALKGLPAEVLMQSVGMFQDDKEKAKPILETLIKGLEGKEDENSQMFLNSLKMRLQMIEHPEMAQQNGQNPQTQAPVEPELTAEQIDELKTKLEAMTKLPEEKTAKALEDFVNSVSTPEFQQTIMPLFRKQDPELQTWLTETMNKLQDSVKEALVLLCKAEDTTEEQYKDALQFRLDVMRSDKARKNIEPDYAALTEEVKAGRFPALVSLVELDAAAASLMDKASEMFSAAEEPTAEQKDALYAEYISFVEKVCASGEMKGPQLQAIMQLASIFVDDNQKTKQICEMLLKGLEGKDDPQSEHLRSMIQNQLDDIKFVTEPMTFTAPEGTDLKGLKELVSQKMEIIMRAGTENLPNEKLAEFLAAVEKYGNADLTAYTSWQIDLIHLIPLIQSADFDIQAFKDKFLACVKTGTEKNLFNINCLQMCVQMVAIASQKPGVKSTEEGKAAIEEMLNAILPVCDSLEVTGREEELKGQFRKSIESFLKELKEAPEEVVPDTLNPATQAIPAPPAANPNAETEALPTEINLDDEPVEAPKSDEAPKTEEAPAPSESTAGTEDDEDEELEEDDLEEDDLEEDEAPKVEIPEPILKMISLPENATVEQCVEYVNSQESEQMQELLMQVVQTGNQPLFLAILDKTAEDTIVACDRIFASKDVQKADFNYALNVRVILLQRETKDDSEAFSAKLDDLKTTVAKSPFPELTKVLETAQDWYAFSLKIKGLEEDPTDEELNALFKEYKALLPSAFTSDSLKSYSLDTCIRSTSIFMQDETKLLEIANLILKNSEGKEGEDWDNLRSAMNKRIESIELKTKPVRFTAKEGATLDELKNSVDEKIQAILEIPDPAAMQKKLNELKIAVAAVKNEELTAYTAWETRIFSFFGELMQTMQDSDDEEKSETKKPDIMKTLTDLIDEGAKVKPTEQSFLMLLQVTLSLMQFEEDAEPEAQAALLTKLQEIAKATDFEHSEELIKAMEGQKERILNPDADEDENEGDDDDEEEEEVSTDFVPAEGATLDEMKAQAHKQISGLTRTSLDLEKLNAFEASVKKAGNEELNACVAWELGIFRFFGSLSTSGEEPDIDKIVSKLTEIVTEGIKLNAFQDETLQLLAQISLNIAPDTKAPETGKKLLEALKTALATSKAQWAPFMNDQIDGILVKLNLPGNPIELKAKTLDGKTVKIEDFAGKTVLIDVWATWCGPCRAETPNIRRAWDVYHDAGFEVIGLSIDDDLDKLTSFVEENDVPWTIVTQQKMKGKHFDDQYGISSIPTMFLVGADGKVITINARGRLMELLSEIYPDVEVPEEEEVPEEIELGDDDDDDETEDEENNSESMAGVEDEPAEEIEEAKPEEISTDFVPPENATPEMLREAVFRQFMQIVQSAKGNPFEPVLKFQKSVNALENTDLTQFLDWNIETLRFLAVKVHTATDIQALADELADLLTKGQKIKALRPEFLSPLTQLSVQLISALDPPAAKKLAAAVQNALASSNEPWTARAAKMIQGILTQMDLPGKPLDLVAKTLDGKEIKIQDFAGKTVLVDVWATWCGPCRAEFPRMAKAYEAFHDAGFEIIGLSVDKDVEKLKDFVEEEKTPWIIATQDGMDLPESFSEKYGIMGIPTMFLVGADGKVITTNARGRLMNLLGEIYPEAAEAARKKAEEETSLDAPADSAAPSQSMSTTEEASQEQTESPAQEASLLDQFAEFPPNTTLNETKQFLENFDQHAYEIQAALQQLPTMEAAMEKFQKIQAARSQAADQIIADEQATEADLNYAVNIKTQGIQFSAQFQNDPKAAEKINDVFAKLIAALEARKAETLVIQVQVEQIITSSLLLGRMPNADEMGATLEKLTAICQRAKGSKCMNGDLMGHFMQMIVAANDLGVDVQKIETACNALREAVLATEDPQLINTADFITGMARRAMLKGKPMELVGTTLDEKEVDIQKDYAGKVTLVDFWATWCNPCVMELKNLEDKYYAEYHDKGFEILGFSIDADRNQLATFLERRNLPWQTICQQGDFDPVYYYGIQAIPCLILVGPDGKVIREIPTMRRDEVLSAELKKIYGE